MAQVSKNKLEKHIEAKLVHTFQLVLTKLSKEEEMDNFLLSFLTPTEQIMFAKRLAIAILLKEGYSDTEISKTLHVTRITVSRLRFFIEARGKGYQFAFQILENEKFREEMHLLLEELLAYAARSAGGRVKPIKF